VKLLFSLYFGILLVLPAFAQQNVISGQQSLDAKMQKIGERVANGDYTAFSDATKLPTATAIQFLYILYNRSGKTDPTRDEAAIDALRSVPGYADYFQQNMATMTAHGEVPVSDFEILKLIGTPEAASVIAPYLFDFKTTSPPDRDLAGESNVGDALWALKQMNLPDAPKTPSEASNSVVLVAWQRWAIEKGFVPKEWSSRIGAPAWLLRMDAMEKVPFAAKSPQSTRPVSSPFLAAATAPVPTNSSSPTAGRSAEETKSPGQTSGMLIATGLLVVLIIGGIFAWKRRSR